MPPFKYLMLSFCLLLLFAFNSDAQDLEEQFDKMLNAQYPADEPGATALVAIDGEIVYHKGFGMANMELDVKMEPDMVLEIGSITKQFTGVAILMLMEQGKLDLDDDITKYIEDYPTHGHHISIHHLLTHTSGIKSYTSLESWTKVWRQDYEPLEMIDLFKNEPMDFAPGEGNRYNNSAYFILGYIIEKASGQTYQEFIETNIFKKLGMNASLYGSNSKIIKKRASGYQKNEDYKNAEYLSLTQPYAAGSLMSTVGDLYIWNRAIRNNTLVKKETIDLAFTNYKLNNGEKLDYGYGWGISKINGSPTLEHSGGIFGYVTNSIYLPEEDVFVAIYSNCDCNGPGQVSARMAALAIDKPYPSEEDVISVQSELLEKLVGVYDFVDSSSRVITIEDGQLYSQRVGSNRFKLLPLKDNTFAFENSFSTLKFEGEGSNTKVIFSDRSNKTEGHKTSKPIPVQEEVEVSEDILNRYVGTYALTPSFDITFTVEDGKFMTQATGQPKFELFAESETMFFLKVVAAKVEFIQGDNGDFDSIILYQGGREMPGKKKG